MNRLLASAIALAISAPALAEPRLELGVLNSTYGTQPDGTWYQSQFEHSLHNKARGASLGVSFPIAGSTRAYIGAKWFGATSHVAKVVPSDVNSNPYSPTGCNGPCLPFAVMYGYGNAYGVDAEIQPGATIYGQRLFLAFGGAMLYGKYVVQMHGDCMGWNTENVCTGGYRDHTLDRMKGWNFTPKIGVGWEISRTVTVQVSVYPAFKEKGHNGTDEQGTPRNDPGLHKGLRVVELKISL